jgi:Protein of unknown function (DUF5818)
MLRKTWMFVFSLLVLTPLLTAQEQIQSNRPSPDDSAAARQLVAWSWMQKPQPMPQPLPPPDNLPPAQKLSRSGNPQAHPQGATRSFVGEIVREGDRFVLRTSEGASYPLSLQDDPKPYEGKKVQINTTLDPDNTIHILKIEPL